MSDYGAGRELDALVAEKAMGWLWLSCGGQCWFGPSSEVGQSDPIYGTTRAADMTRTDLVVQEAWWLDDSRNLPAEMVRVPHYSTDIAAAWQVVEAMRERRIGEAEMRQVFSLAHCYPASEVATAICRAALAAVSAPVPQTQEGRE